MRFILRILILSSLAVLAGWLTVRSDSLTRAEQVAATAKSPEELAESVRLAMEHLRRRPWSRGAALLAARGLSRLDYPDRAEAYYKKVRDLDLEDLHIRADAILRSNDRDRAREAFEGILKRWPEDVTAVRRLAGLHYSQMRYQPALDAAERLARIEGHEAEGYRLIGVVHHDTSNPEPAVAAFERVLSVDPQLRSIPPEGRRFFWYRYAQDLIAIGRASDARRVLEAWLSSSDDPPLRILLGKAALQMSDLDGAEAAWRTVVDNSPDLAAGWQELGRLELLKNRPEEALRLLQRAADLAPDNTETLYNLQSALLRLGRREEADEVGRRLDRLRQSRPGPPTGMGAGQTVTTQALPARG